MTISLRWGQEPFWFASLNNDKQELLIAEYTLAHETKKDKERRKERITQERINRQLAILKERRENEC